MTRNNLAMNDIKEIRTPNGGRINAKNGMTRESARAQRTSMWTEVTVITNDNRVYKARKKDIEKATLQKYLHKIIDRF